MGDLPGPEMTLTGVWAALFFLLFTAAWCLLVYIVSSLAREAVLPWWRKRKEEADRG